MPLLDNVRATTAIATMGLKLQIDDIDHTLRHQTDHYDEGTSTSSSDIDDGVEEMKCLFCNESSLNVEQNLEHMSTTHGLHIVTEHLMVDVGSLLAYFHLIVSEYHECLFCGTQRNTLQAIRQHMIAKGHCKYDLTAKDAEFRDFYDFSSSEAEDDLARSYLALRLSEKSQRAIQDRSKKSRQSLRSSKRSAGLEAFSVDQASAPSSPEAHTDTDDDSNHIDDRPETPSELSTRAQKQDYTLNNQLAQLRADDRRSLLHLPVSQQRALLATYHKQAEKVKRSEQTQRGNLESAGNSFARLGTTRLVRQPPHTGRVQTLKR